MFFFDDVINGIFGTYNQSTANATNERINERNLQAQQAQFDESMAWSKEQFAKNQEFQREMTDLAYNRNTEQTWKMWNANNEYNSASAQRQRLEAAGLNPNLMMSGGSAGSAAGSISPTSAPSGGSVGVPSAGGVPSSIAMQAGQQTLAAALIDGLFQMGVRAKQASKLGSEKEAIDIQNMFGKERAEVALQKLKKEADSASSRADIDRIESAYRAATFSTDVTKRNYDVMMQKAQIYQMTTSAALQVAQTAKLKEETKWITPQAQQALALSAAQAYLYCKQSNLTVEQTKTEISRRLLIDAQKDTETARAENIRSQTKQINSSPWSNMSKEQIKSYANSFVNQMSQQEHLNRLDIRQKGADYWNPFKYSGSSASSLIDAILPG